MLGNRSLARGWKERARDNIAAIQLAAEIEADERPATREEQERLIRFTGFGASDLANGVFRRPGEVEFREGWYELGSALEDCVGGTDYASLARCTQYAHFTPEFIVHAMWAGLQRLGWRGGRVLEPGTPREREVVKLVSNGLLNKQIAGDLGLSEITVKIHRSSAMRKMKARTVVHLIRMLEALERGAMQPQTPE